MPITTKFKTQYNDPREIGKYRMRIYEQYPNAMVVRAHMNRDEGVYYLSVDFVNEDDKKQFEEDLANNLVEI